MPFAGRDMFSSTVFWLGCFYVCFPLGLLIYGWNDVGDAITDSANPRKDSWLFGARPDANLRRQLPWIILFSQTPFLIAFTWVGGPILLLWFVAVALVNYTYNNLDFKSRPGLDLLNQAGYLLVLVLASWLCGVPQIGMAALVFGALFAMHSHLFGQLMDIDEDRLQGRRSTAIQIGVRGSKGLLVAMLIVEAIIAANSFRYQWVAWFLLAGAAFFLVDALIGPQRYPLRFCQAFFLGWNLIVLLSMHFVWKYDVFLVAPG
jgi:4-hydroxybenzoate polyprenyltransferase